MKKLVYGHLLLSLFGASANLFGMDRPSKLMAIHFTKNSSSSEPCQGLPYTSILATLERQLVEQQNVSQKTSDKQHVGEPQGVTKFEINGQAMQAWVQILKASAFVADVFAQDEESAFDQQPFFLEMDGGVTGEQDRLASEFKSELYGKACQGKAQQSGESTPDISDIAKLLVNELWAMVSKKMSESVPEEEQKNIEKLCKALSAASQDIEAVLNDMLEAFTAQERDAAALQLEIPKMENIASDEARESWRQALQGSSLVTLMDACIKNISVPAGKDTVACLKVFNFEAMIPSHDQHNQFLDPERKKYSFIAQLLREYWPQKQQPGSTLVHFIMDKLWVATNAKNRDGTLVHYDLYKDFYFLSQETKDLMSAMHRMHVTNWLCDIQTGGETSEDDDPELTAYRGEESPSPEEILGATPSLPTTGISSALPASQLLSSPPQVPQTPAPDRSEEGEVGLPQFSGKQERDNVITSVATRAEKKNDKKPCVIS